MRTLNLVMLAIFYLSVAWGQTAEEILWKTQAAYRGLTNYVDEGTYIKSARNYPGQNTPNFYMAIDRNENVNQWLHDEISGKLSGAQYVKSEKEALGSYTRIGTQDPSFLCSISEAGARLMGTGGDIFFIINSLFYPGYRLGMTNDSSYILHFDNAQKLADTTINGASCYVIKTHITTEITEEFAARSNFAHDSMFHLLDLPVEQRGGPRTEPGPRSTAYKYFIRKSDFMIVRYERFSLEGDTDIVNYHLVLTLSPRYNVKHFVKYLEQ